METKYLPNGYEVYPLREVEGGWLYNLAFIDEYGEKSFICNETTYFAERLYDKPPTSNLHKDIIKLKGEILELEEKRSKLRKINVETEALAKEIPNYAFIQMLVDYMNEDFEYVLWEKDYNLTPKNKTYIPRFIKVVCTENGGYQLYKMRSESYSSYDDMPIRIFRTKKEAQDYARKDAIKKLNNGVSKDNYPWNKRQVESWYKDIRVSSGIKDHPDILREYEKAIRVTGVRDEKEMRKKLQKEIDDKKAKLDTLKTK